MHKCMPDCTHARTHMHTRTHTRTHTHAHTHAHTHTHTCTNARLISRTHTHTHTHDNQPNSWYITGGNAPDSTFLVIFFPLPWVSTFPASFPAWREYQRASPGERGTSPSLNEAWPGNKGGLKFEKFVCVKLNAGTNLHDVQ